MRRPIRILSDDAGKQPRICDVLIEEDKRTYLEIKTNKGLEKIPFEEVEMQVELARKAVL